MRMVVILEKVERKAEKVGLRVTGWCWARRPQLLSMSVELGQPHRGPTVTHLHL